MPNIRLTQAQEEIAKDNHRFRVVCCGRRFGKTTLSVVEIASLGALRPNSRIAYIAPTYQQARDIAWEALKRVTHGICKEVNESRLEIILKNDSVIVLRGWESIETLRGQAFDFLVIDEVAMMRNFWHIWQEVLRPTLTDRKGSAMFISTPKGYNHFYDLFNMQDDSKKGKDYKSFHFTSYDNNHIPKEEVDKAREELTEDAFAQEYLADFRKTTGISHKYWDRDVHFIDAFDVPREWQRFRGFDYGLVHFTASPRFAIHSEDDTWFVELSYLANNTDVKGHAEAIKAQDYGLEFMPMWGDPSGKQWVEEFGMYGIHIQNANKSIGQGFKGWVEFCVEKVNERLKPVPGHTVYLPNGKVIENAPRLFVFKGNGNEKLVQQIEMQHWKETTAGVTVPILDEDDDPTGGHYDLMAALRYAVVSYKTDARFDKNTLPQFNREKLEAYNIG